MDDDLNTPGAMEVLFTTVTRFNSSRDPALAAAVHEMARVVGLELRAGTGETDRESAELVRQRDDARASRACPTGDSRVASGRRQESVGGPTSRVFPCELPAVATRATVTQS